MYYKFRKGKLFLLNKRVIVECDSGKGGFTSTLFTRDKKDDASFWIILNLKHLNHYVGYEYFEMKPLSDALL